MTANDKTGQDRTGQTNCHSFIPGNGGENGGGGICSSAFFQYGKSVNVVQKRLPNFVELFQGTVKGEPDLFKFDAIQNFLNPSIVCRWGGMNPFKEN